MLCFACAVCSGGSEGATTQSPSLLAAVQRIIPSSQAAAVLPLLVKLMYLETQVDNEAAAAGATALHPTDYSSFDCGL